MTTEQAYQYLKNFLTCNDGYLEFEESVKVTTHKDGHDRDEDIDSCNVENDEVLFWSGGKDFHKTDFLNEFEFAHVLELAFKTIRLDKDHTQKQYKTLKEKHPDALLLFRLGDFYETYFEDAEDASNILGITLTKRNTKPNRVSMAGFPFHALDTYLPKLIRAGKRVAICDDMSEPITIKRK